MAKRASETEDDVCSQVSLHGSCFLSKAKIAKHSPLRTAIPPGRDLAFGISADGQGFQGDQGDRCAGNKDWDLFFPLPEETEMIQQHAQKIQSLEADNLAIVQSLAPMTVRSASAEYLGWVSAVFPKKELESKDVYRLRRLAKKNKPAAKDILQYCYPNAALQDVENEKIRLRKLDTIFRRRNSSTHAANLVELDNQMARAAMLIARAPEIQQEMRHECWIVMNYLPKGRALILKHNQRALESEKEDSSSSESEDESEAIS